MNYGVSLATPIKPNMEADEWFQIAHQWWRFDIYCNKYVKSSVIRWLGYCERLWLQTTERWRLSLW